MTCFWRSSRLPCLMALMTDSRTATLTQWIGVLVEAGERRQPIAQHLHEIEQLERTGQLEADQVAVRSHGRGVSNI